MWVCGRMGYRLGVAYLAPTYRCAARAGQVDRCGWVGGSVWAGGGDVALASVSHARAFGVSGRLATRQGMRAQPTHCYT